MHQVLVRVEGWDQVAPVSVDKVGVYFRLAKPQTNQVSAIVSSQLLFLENYLDLHHTMVLSTSVHR